MARRKRCVVKRKRQEEGKRRKREEKEEKSWGPNRKKKKKKKSPCASFSSVQSSFFGSIRNTLFRKKHPISTFVLMQDFVDEQIM